MPTANKDAGGDIIPTVVRLSMFVVKVAQSANLRANLASIASMHCSQVGLDVEQT